MHHPVLDTIVIGVTSVIASACPLLLLSQATTVDAHFLELELLLLPLIGAILVSGGFILLNPNPETRRIVIGRCIFSLFFGVLAPQLLGWIHPSLAAMAVRPAALLLIGGTVAGVVFVLSKPFVLGMYERAEGEAKAALDKVQQQLHPVVEETTIVSRKTPVAGNVAELPATQTVTTTTVETTSAKGS